MDDQIQRPLIVPVHLDEVVAAAQGADGVAGPVLVDLAEAAQRAQIGLGLVGVGVLPYLHPRGDVGTDKAVQALQIQRLLVQNGGLHAAADIHAHHVGHHLVMEGHGGADGAALARVGVGHHPDTAVDQIILVTHEGDLRPSGLVNRVDKHFGGVIRAGNFDHMVHLSSGGASSSGTCPLFLTHIPAYAAMSR